MYLNKHRKHMHGQISAHLEIKPGRKIESKPSLRPIFFWVLAGLSVISSIIVLTA